MSDVDLFVIGGGSGGVACARRAAGYGAQVALAESSRVGGTCVIRGCVPKKLMHYAANFAEAFKAAPGYGWRFDAPRLDFQALLASRNKDIARLNGIYIGMLEQAGVRLIPERARIAGRAGGGFVVEAGGERIDAARVLIATGGRPSLPEVPGIEHAITSDETLEDLYDQPKRLVVVGAGYIGVEIASIMQALGSETSLVLRGDMPLRGFDDDLRRELTAQLVGHGLDMRVETVVERIGREGGRLRLDTNQGPIETDAVIYATGREPIPNTSSIGLEELGVKLGPTGAVEVDGQYESNVPGILAVGDCADHAGNGMKTGQFDLTPVAIAEGRHVAARLYDKPLPAVRYDTIPTAIFGLPQAGSVGLGEARARALGHDIAVFRTAFRPMLHTLTGMTVRTMMKVIVDKATDRVLGVHMVGDDAAEIIQGFAVAMTAGATKAQLDATVALHPTAAEELVLMSQPVA
jgi:glutathione reductase (NADPH)